jgi:hypothetical protein
MQPLRPRFASPATRAQASAQYGLSGNLKLRAIASPAAKAGTTADGSARIFSAGLTQG